MVERIQVARHTHDPARTYTAHAPPEPQSDIVKVTKLRSPLDEIVLELLRIVTHEVPRYVRHRGALMGERFVDRIERFAKVSPVRLGRTAQRGVEAGGKAAQNSVDALLVGRISLMDMHATPPIKVSGVRSIFSTCPIRIP